RIRKQLHLPQSDFYSFITRIPYAPSQTSDCPSVTMGSTCVPGAPPFVLGRVGFHVRPPLGICLSSPLSLRRKAPENGVGALHQKWALTMAPLEPSFKMSPLATAKTQPHPAAQQRPSPTRTFGS